jgi:hypothetical protein
MTLHGPLSVTMGVPNVAQTAAYYTDFGLAPCGLPGSWRVPAACSSEGRHRRPLSCNPDDLAALMTGAHAPD